MSIKPCYGLHVLMAAAVYLPEQDWSVVYDPDPANDYVESAHLAVQNLVDNTYGSSAIGWGRAYF